MYFKECTKDTLSDKGVFFDGESMSKEIREKRKKVICDLVTDELYVPMKEKELAMFLQVPKAEKDEFSFWQRES